MAMAEKGWVWEGQGLDPGVYPSIFGVGEGAQFFGLRKVHFMFHETTDLALRKLSPLDKVMCDISKWRFRNCGERSGSECYPDARMETILAEAEKVSAFSLKYPNVAGGYFDDMKGLMDQNHHDVNACVAVKDALTKHNPNMILESVVYTHELGDAAFWNPLIPYIDVVSLWVWGYQRLATLEEDLEKCRSLFANKPINMGCYLRDYPTVRPMPMEAIKRQWNVVQRALEDGRIQGFDILGTVLIDGHLEQATWIRDFIRDH